MADREANAFDDIRNAAKRGEPDRYVAALLAPRRVRDDLIAIAALSSELRRSAETVSEPAIGEIRIQFFRDALSAAASGERSGQPIADAAAAAIARHHVPSALIDDLLAAHVHRLYADSPADDAALALEIAMTDGVLFRIAALALGLEMSRAVEHAITHAASAYGLARIGLDLPRSLARGRNPLPEVWSAGDWRRAVDGLCAESRSALRACRASLHGSDARLNTALLPLAVVEPYLAALEGANRDPAHDIAEIAPLSRVWRLGRAHMLGRV